MIDRGEYNYYEKMVGWVGWINHNNTSNKDRLYHA